ncbi:hypothetical protein IBX73_06105 [candidate division WOR-3 bacterium]|nr:hypothetical protein [candidate division WOR-3 bacterium]
MRVLLIFTAIIIYLFLLVFIESELVKIEGRKEDLASAVTELENEKKQLGSILITHTNLASIEAAAREMGLVFPQNGDIVGVVE